MSRLLLKILFAALVLLALFGRLGQTPLGHEEPRRALIALELLYGDSPLQATLHGENYYRKPPLYNWVLASFYKLFGSTNEFVGRLPSVLSFLLLTFFIYKISREYIGRKQAAIAALIFFISEDLMLYYSRMAEMDLFYSLISLPVIIMPWVYLEKNKHWHFFLIAPFLAAIGFLSKGLPSVAFVGISMLSAILLHKQYKLLINWKVWLSILVFLVPISVYFYSQYLGGTLEDSLTTLFNESANRTTQNNSLLKRVTHFVIFPLDILKGMLPGALFIFLVRRKQVESPFLKAVIVLFICNLALYVLSPGARLRYVYMLFPLLAILFGQGFYNLNQRYINPIKKTVTFLVIVILVSLVVASIGWFNFDFELLILLLLAGLLLWMLFKTKKLSFKLELLLLMLILRACVDFISIQEQFITQDKSWIEKKQASELIAEYPDKSIYLNTKSEQYYTFSYEYCRLKKEVFRHNIELTDTNGLYIVREQYKPKELVKIRNFAIGKDSTFIIAKWP